LSKFHYSVAAEHAQQTSVKMKVASQKGPSPKLPPSKIARLLVKTAPIFSQNGPIGKNRWSKRRQTELSSLNTAKHKTTTLFCIGQDLRSVYLH